MSAIDWLVETVRLTILNDQRMYYQAVEQLECTGLVSITLFIRAAREANMYKAYFSLSDAERKAVLKYLSSDLEEYLFKPQTVPTTPPTKPLQSIFDDQERNMHPSAPIMPQPAQLPPNSYTTAVEPREDLVFGHTLGDKSKDQLMIIIRMAKQQSDSLSDLVDTSTYVAKQVADIDAGIALCVKALDK